MPESLSARELLQSLVGKEIKTASGRRNVVLAIAGDDVLVGTGRSPEGMPVPIAWVEDALSRLRDTADVEISVDSLGYRSAFRRRRASRDAFRGSRPELASAGKTGKTLSPTVPCRVAWYGRVEEPRRR